MGLLRNRHLLPPALQLDWCGECLPKRRLIQQPMCRLSGSWGRNYNTNSGLVKMVEQRLAEPMSVRSDLTTKTTLWRSSIWGSDGLTILQDVGSIPTVGATPH
eukprot:scaffold67_cov139-Amphora_coffeaeformis.AAC.3